MRAAALLLLTLPGAAFIYQGDEIGMPDGPGVRPPIDRTGRDRHRHPMQWEPEPLGGFTTGRPWLPLVDPEARSVAAQREDPASLLSFYRELIALRRTLARPGGAPRRAAGVLAFRRGEHVVTIDLAQEPVRARARGRRCWPARGTVVRIG